MGFETTEEYTKECGCEYVTWMNDVDRPFMCYTEWKTEIRKRCDKHLQEYKEYCEKRKKRRTGKTNQRRKTTSTKITSS